MLNHLKEPLPEKTGEVIEVLRGEDFSKKTSSSPAEPAGSIPTYFVCHEIVEVCWWYHLKKETIIVRTGTQL